MKKWNILGIILTIISLVLLVFLIESSNRTKDLNKQVENLTSELEQVTCWQEICSNHETVENTGLSGDFTTYKYKNEEAIVGKMELVKNYDVLPVSTMNSVLYQTIGSQVGKTTLGVDIVYAAVKLYNYDGELLTYKEYGTRPNWLEGEKG